MKTTNFFASVLASAVCLIAAVLPFGKAQITHAYSPPLTDTAVTVSAADLQLGDINGDNSIDSSDASLILAEYSAVSTGGKSTFTKAQKKAADLDSNNTIDSSDASDVLRYYAYVSTGGTLPIKEYLDSSDDPKPVTTTVPAETTTKKTTVTTAETVTTTKATKKTTTTSVTKKTTVTTTTAKKTTTTTKTPVTTTTAAGPVKVSDIRITRTEMSVNVNEGDLAAYVTMLPAEAANKSEIWSSSDESVAIVDSEGWVIGVSEGKCTVTVKSADNPGISAQISVTVNDAKRVKDIRLTRTTMTLQEGCGELAAYVTMLPATAVNKAEIWSSSNESVAIVDSEGWVIAKKAGNSIITVQSVDNPNVFASVLVIVVKEPVYVPVREIQVSESEFSLTVGEQAEAAAKVLPVEATNQSVSWASSDDTIAVTDRNGKITAVGIGSCVITVSSTENSNIKANIIVNVKASGKVTEILLSKYEMKIPVGKTGISWVTMLPDEAENKDELWTSSDSSVATVDKYGWIYGVSEGECTITVFCADNPAVKAEIAVTIVDGSVDEPEKINFSHILSNQSTDEEIAFLTPLPEEATGRYIIDFVITDADGKTTTISTPTLIVPAMKNIITMLTADTNEFTAEAYLTNLVTAKQAKIGVYRFTLAPRSAEAVSENIYDAFYFLEGIEE